MTLAIMLLALAVGYYRNATIISSDGQRYVNPERPVMEPFHRRWLLPWLCGGSMRRWQVVSYVSLLATGPLVYWFTQSVVAVWLWAWLFPVQNAAARPVLVDMASIALALGAVLAWPYSWPAALLLAALSGACKETGPVFAAAWSLNPWLLVGLVGVAWFRQSYRGPHPKMKWPWRFARFKHDPLCWRRMLAPWGAMILLAPLGWAWDRATLAAVLSIGLGYGQLLRAQDGARLYLWAAPAVLVLAARVDAWWLPPLLVAHPFLAIAEPRRIVDLMKARAEAEA